MLKNKYKIGTIILLVILLLGAGTQIDFNTQIKNINSFIIPYVCSATGCKSNFVFNKLLQITNVQDFTGVDPTGATDSSTGIQAAVTAAGAAGGTLYFGNGIYRVDNQVNFLSNVYYKGNGAIIYPGTNIIATSFPTNGVVFYCAACSNVTFDGFQFLQNTYTNKTPMGVEPGWPTGWLSYLSDIWFGGGDGDVVKNCYFNQNWVGIAYYNVTNSQVENNYFNNGAAFVAVIAATSDVHDVDIGSNRVENNSDDGICFCTQAGSSGINMYHVKSHDNYFSKTLMTIASVGEGIRFQSFGTGNIYAGSSNGDHFFNMSSPVIGITTHVSDITISNAIINGWDKTPAGGAAIAVGNAASGYTADSIHIINPTIINPATNLAYGIGFNQTTHSDVIGGRVTANIATLYGDGAITLHTSSNYNYVTGVRAYNTANPGYAIYEDNTSNYNTIRSNNVSDNVSVTNQIIIQGANSVNELNYGSLNLNLSNYALTVNSVGQLAPLPINSVLSAPSYTSFGCGNTSTIGTWYFRDNCALGISTLVVGAGTNQAQSPEIVAEGNLIDNFGYYQLTSAGIGANASLQSGLGMDVNTTQPFGYIQADNVSVPTALPFFIEPNGGALTIAQIKALDAALAVLGTGFQAGTQTYCIDCTTAATCVTGGSGHVAVKNGASTWTCQ